MKASLNIEEKSELKVMSHLHPGLISAYNSLTDRHLAGYFSNTRIRRHLQRAGLITRSGRIVPDKEYRHKLIQRANQRHIRECLAQAIFYKVLEMERLHQKEIKRKLEEYARREKVHKIKVDRTKRYEDDVPRILSPHPPMGARAVHKQYSGPEGEPSESSDSPSSSRPNTAPGKMQRPVRLKPIHSNTTTMSLRRSSPYRTHQSSQGHHPQTFNCTTLACPHTLFQQMDKHSGRGLKTMETPPHNGISPYCLPVINNFVTPVPPTTMRRERGGKVTRSTVRARRLRSTTASSGADVTEDLPLLRSSIEQSKVFVNMVYFGKSVHLSHDLTDLRDDIKVFQQHCGGENLCVFKGKLREGEMFQFFSRRHRGFPFSLTFFLNGLQVERLSSCCEFKHRKGSRLGGKHGHFGFSGVAGASPCYKCIIFMGLDKKPTPPSRTIKENGGRHTLSTSYKVRSERSGGYTASHSECETSQPLDMKTQVEEEPVCKDNKVRDEYDEDFEADDEGPAEEGAAREKNSPSRENKKQAEEKETSESEDDEKDAHSSSSSLDSDQEQSDDDTIKDDEEEKPPAEIVYEETVAEPDQTDKPKLAKDDLAALKDSDIHGSVEDSTEIEITDNSLLTGSEKRQSVLSSEDQDGKSTIDQRKDEERDRAKSVQEKLVEAILKPSHCSSEPELSDTSTEESVDEGLKHNNKDAVPEKLMIVVKEKTEFEDVVAGESELSQTREEEEEEDEALQDAQENNESIDDQEIKTDQKMTEEEDTMEAFEDLENTGEEETKLQEEIKADIHEEAKVGSSDDEASKKTAEKEEEALEEVKHGTESKEGDTSLPPEANRDTDEIAYEVESTMDVKENPPTDEQEDLHHEESAVHNAEKMQQEMEDGVSGAEDNAGSSKSTAEESEDTVKKTIDVEEEDVKHESTQDDNNRETDKAEAEGRTDGSEAEVCESGEEEDKSMQLQEKENMKIFEEEDEEKEQSHVNTGRSEKDETENEDKTFKESIEEMKNENPTEEDQDVEKAIDKEEEVTDRNVLDPEQPEEDERNVFTEESEGNGLHEGDQNTAQNEERNSEKAEYESRAGQSETMVSKTDEDNKDIETPDELDWKKENTLDGNAKNCNINTDAGEGDAKKTIEEISEKTSNELEKGSIDAENGEISAESKTCENEESPLVDEQDVIDVKSCEEEETEGVDAHENTEGCDDVNEVSEAGVFQPSGNEEVIEAEDRHEQSKNISDPEETAVDVKNRKDFGRTEESKNGTKLSLDNENQESSLIEKNNNTKSSSSELTESSVHQEQRPPSVTVILVESSEQIEDRKMKALERSEDPEGNVVRVGLSAADGGNKDTEDAIKASEDGASVLQKPQDEESDDARQVGAAGKGPPEAAAEISDLVTNWVNMHQSSKFFETFVEPLEDLSETSETPSLEMQKLAEVGGISDSEERMHMLRDQSESSVKTTMEAKETELDRIEAQNDCAKQQEKENTEVQELRSKAGSEKSNEESTKELDMPPEVHKSIKTMNNDEESTEVQSISSSHNSGAGGKHASVSGSQPVERSSGNDTDVTDKHTVAKEMEEVLLATRTEEPNHSKHPDELEDENTTQETIKDEGEKVSQMTHFASKSDVGSLQEFHREEIQAEVSEESRVEMIQDFTDQLSTFSGQDKSLFGHNSYSLMTSVRTESEH